MFFRLTPRCAARVQTFSVRWLTRRIRHSFLLLSAAVTLVTLSTSLLLAGEEPVQVRDLSVGFQGHFKVGEWTPLRMQVESAAPINVRLVVEASDADDYIALSEVKRALQAGTQQLQTCFRTARMEGSLTVRLLNGQGETLYRKTLRPGSGELRKGWKGDRRLRLLVGLSADKDAMQSLIGNATDVSASASESWLPVSDIGTLPTESRGYDSVESLLLLTAGSEAPLKLLAGPRHDALRNWVSQGGHLIVSVGSGARTFSALPLAEWFPVTLKDQQEFRQLPGLEAYIGKNVSIRLNGTLSAARLPDISGPEVLARELDGPVVVRFPYGFGRVTVLGIDLDASSLPEAQIRRELVKRLVAAARPAVATQATQSVGRLANPGITDLATQLQGAQEDFSGINRVPYWGVMGLLVLYIAVLGPLDYLIVHRWLRRPHLTWITFPLVILIAVFGSIWGATRQNGVDLKVNQFTIVDIDADSGAERGWSWYTLLSPRTRRYSVDIQPIPAAGWKVDKSATSDASATGSTKRNLPVSDVQVTWVGVPENTVGGLYRTGGMNATGRTYHLTDGSLVPDLPIQQWSTKTMLAQWSNREPGVAESHLESAGPGRLRGTVSHRLPLPLDDCLLIHAGRVYFSNRNRRLTPLQEWEPASPQAQQRDLRSYLTGTEASRQKARSGQAIDEIVVKSKPYDPNSTDRFDLLRMLSFHQAAGGKSYTGLDHTSLGRLELTDLMESGRAVLIGRVSGGNAAADGPQAAVVSVDGETLLSGNRETFVRIVFPVKQVTFDSNPSLPKLNQK